MGGQDRRSDPKLTRIAMRHDVDRREAAQIMAREEVGDLPYARFARIKNEDLRARASAGNQRADIRNTAVDDDDFGASAVAQRGWRNAAGLQADVWKVGIGVF